jgi:hypothetical protein
MVRVIRVIQLSHTGATLRILRRALIGAVVIATVSVLPAASAAAAPPAAPFNAMVMDGSAGNVPLKGQLVLDSSNTTSFYFGPNGPATDSNLESVLFAGQSATHQWVANMMPPTGSPLWVAGTTYTTSVFPADPSVATFDTFGDGIGCNTQTGHLTVLEVGRDPDTHRVTTFAAVATASCDAIDPAITVDLRGNSSLDYVGAAGSVSLLDFGTVAIGSTSAAQSVTFTSMGSQPVTFGVASIPGAAGDYSIANDTCSNGTFAYGETCTVAVQASPHTISAHPASLVLPDNTASTQKIVRLMVTGQEAHALTFTPASLDFGQQDPQLDGTPKTVTVTSTGAFTDTLGTVSIGGTTPAAFAISADTCSGAVLAVGQSCTVTVVPHPTGMTLQLANLLVPDQSVFSPRIAELSVQGAVTERGTYAPLGPIRIMDTRTGLGAPAKPIGPGGVVHLQVESTLGVPASSAAAVVLNVTVTGPTANGFLTVYPTGVARPTASSLNFVKGWTGANSVTVALGQNGSIDIYNSAGSTQVIVDVMGFYGTADLPAYYGGGQFQPTLPERLLDTRDFGQKLPGGFFVRIPVSYGASVDPHIRALVVNVTAVSPDAAGFLTAWDGDAVFLPPTSTLNYTKGKVVPNLAVVPVRPCENCGSATGLPSIGVYTSKASHVLVDIVGFYDDATLSDGLRFTAITPSRITDTRTGLGVPAALGPATTVNVTTPGSLLTMPLTAALALNVTAVAPTAATYLTVWPTGLTRPTVSNLNPAAGQTIPNAAVTLIGAGDAFSVYNHQGTTNLVIDAVGTFWVYPGTASSAAATAGRSRQSLRSELFGEYVQQAR